MSDLDTRLTAALNADGPPPRDAMFRVQVLERLERARFMRHVARTIVVSALLGLIAAVNAPLIEAWLAAASQDVRVIIAVAAAATMCVVPALLIQSRMRIVRRLGRWLLPYAGSPE
jgi:hypothetical protein